MKKFFVASLALVLCVCAQAAKKPTPKLVFDASKGVAGSVTLPNGKKVNYTAYTNLYYVTHVEDSTYQYMNVFVPEGATQSTPIFMPNYVGGYMAAAPRMIDEGDASGRALAEGYVVAIPGARGRNSMIVQKGKTVYTGRAPKGLLDLKAAVRYLRFFDRDMLGDAEHIITDGTSAGGAMSSLLGSTGNNPSYEPMLIAMGAADTRDDVFAAVCFCPIIDLDHADMAYEWLYGGVDEKIRPVTSEQVAVSKELAAQFPAYINSLGLKKKDGSDLNADNYRDYIKQLLMTRGSLTTFSIANDVAKYFAIIPALFMGIYPGLSALNIMGLHSPQSAVLSAIIYNAVIIIALIPLALKGVKYREVPAGRLLARNLLVYGLGGLAAPFVFIKLLDMLMTAFGV